MKHEEIISKLKENVCDVRRIVSEMDKQKAQHLVDQIAQAGFHEVVKLRKETLKRVRLARIDLKKHGRFVLSESERLQEVASTKAEKIFSTLSSRFDSERARWRGKRRSS